MSKSDFLALLSNRAEPKSSKSIAHGLPLNPDWRYEFWDGNRMKAFVENNYPEMATI